MPKEYEYHEEKQAQEDFKKGMKAVFQGRRMRPSQEKTAKKRLNLKPANPALPATLAARLERQVFY